MHEQALQVLAKDLLMHEHTAPVYEQALRVFENNLRANKQALR